MNNPEPSKYLLKKNKLEELAALEKKQELRQGLPHLYGWKWYKWAREFFESTEKENFLVAANQISKSSTQIRKCIEWGGNPTLWPKLWPGLTPNQFWYLYPNRDTADAEFETKWKLFLPAGKYKDHPTYGWKVIKERNQVKSIRFNSGVIIYFKTYNQDSQDLQAGTCFAMFCDEELPIEHLAELQNRMNATDGYFHMVFTATLGQDHWRKCMEPHESEEETHPLGRKWQISMYDCLTYEDGGLTHWTTEKIKRIEAKCGSKAEILRRVHGRFVVSGGLMYEAFDYDRNTCDPFQIPEHWHIYTGVDIGSGGEKGHPSAMTFVAVAPDFRFGAVYRGWRGDGIQTESGDILLKYQELRGKQKPMLQQYDWESKEFAMVAVRNGETFTPADKGRATGRQILNVLFKHGMIKIFRGDNELDKLITELSSLLELTKKTSAKDDFVDSFRYAVARIPWDWTVIDKYDQVADTTEKLEAKIRTEVDERKEYHIGMPQEDGGIEDEFAFWNDLLHG